MSAAPATSGDQLLAEAEKAAGATDWSRAADILADAPEQPRFLDKRAFYLSRAKRYEESRAVLAILREKDPQNFLWPHMTGYQFYEEGRYDEAVPWLREAYRLHPSHLRNLYRLAQCRRHQGELVKAKLAAGQVLKLWHGLPAEAKEREAKTFAKASYLLGRLQVDRDPRGAVGLLEQAAEHDPGDHDKHYMLGKAYRRSGQADRGLEALRRAQRIKPGRTYIELELADALGAAGDTEDARRCLRRGLRGVRGWQAWKAARVALSLDMQGEARRMLDEAARDRKVKRSPQFEELKAKIDAAAPDTAPAADDRPQQRRRECGDAHRPERSRRRRSGGSPGPRDGQRPGGSSAPPKVGAPSTGKVHHTRPDRGFGFLVDDADGERCHFRLADGDRFADGAHVRFVRADTERGPAAQRVELVA